VPEPLRPLVAAGMAKDPERRPADASTLVTELRTIASGAYGPDWEERGRSHLGEAALLLAALWPSGAPPATQGTTVERISLHRRLPHRRISMAKAAIAVGAIAVVAVAVAALTRSPAHGSARPASATTKATAPKLPVLYNFGGADAAVWNLPEIRPGSFPIFADGLAAITGMHWARWNGTTAVTSSATYYDRTGPCCTKSDQHYFKVTVTLSDVRYRGGPRPGPYFTRMVITGRGFRTLTYTYGVLGSGSFVSGGWTGGPAPPTTTPAPTTPAPTSAAAPTPTTPVPSTTATSGASDYNDLAQLDQAITDWVVQSKHTGLETEADCKESAADEYTCDVFYLGSGAEHVAVVAVTPSGGSFTVVSYK